MKSTSTDVLLVVFLVVFWFGGVGGWWLVVAFAAPQSSEGAQPLVSGSRDGAQGVEDGWSRRKRVTGWCLDGKKKYQHPPLGVFNGVF